MSTVYHIYLPNSVKKSLAKIPFPWKLRITQVIDRLVLEPYIGEKMEGDYKDMRKIRVWPYRIVYTIQEDIKFIKIKEIEHRGHTSYD